MHSCRRIKIFFAMSFYCVDYLFMGFMFSKSLFSFRKKQTNEMVDWEKKHDKFYINGGNFLLQGETPTYWYM